MKRIGAVTLVLLFGLAVYAGFNVPPTPLAKARTIADAEIAKQWADAKCVNGWHVIRERYKFTYAHDHDRTDIYVQDGAIRPTDIVRFHAK